MNRDKQIEEMAKDICSEYDCIIPCQSCAHYEYANCRDVKSAEKLYNAGYRKASYVACEIFEEIWKLVEDCNIVEKFKEPHFNLHRFMFGLAELKKKYTEDTNANNND